MNFKDTFHNIKSAFSGSEKKEYENAVKKMVNAIKQQHSLYRKEIREWKMARFVALSSENPRRKLLIDLYEDIMTDAFIWGRCETRKLRISNKGFAIVNKEGDIDEEKTKLLQKRWMNEFVKYAVESIYYGYSLLYPGKLDQNGYIKELDMVYRDHVVPETKEILKEVHDMKGVRFDEPPFNRWCVFINHKDFLGLLDKAAPLWIFKKHSWQNWDEFEEMYGVPIRTATVASTDKRVQAEVDNWLRDLGSAAWGRFPEGVEIDIKESKSRDAFNVFNEKRKAANEELATLIDGHFETAKDTGSRAKAGSIIESTQNLITLDDETRVQFVINDDLMPMLRDLGYPFAEDDQFIWNDNEQLSPKERMEIFKGVKALGYRVKKEQVESEMDVEIDDSYTPPAKPPKDPKADFNTPHAHTDECGAHLVTYREIDFEITAKLTDDEEELLRQIWEDPDSVNWSYKEFKATHSKLLSALTKGFGAVDFDFESEDHLTMQMLRANVHRFGMDKTQKEIYDLNQIIKDPEVDDYSRFRNRAKKLFPNYKDYWLRTEYDQVLAVSQMAAKYNEMMEDIDVAPFWRLNAIIDGGTTEICKGLDGKVFRKDDANSWTFLPPNHWRCRSDAEDVLEGYDGEVSDLGDAIGADPDGWERMKKSGHNVNWGDKKQAFTATQGYLNQLPIGEIDPANFEYNIFELKDVSKITEKPSLPNRAFRFENFTDRSGKARFEDVQGAPVWLTPELLENIPDNLKRAISDTISNADELYWMESGKGNIKSYWKHYKEGSVNLTAYYDNDSISKITQVQLIAEPDQFRKGLLIYTPQNKIETNLAKYNLFDKDWRKEGFNSQNGGYLVHHKEHGANELANNIYTGKKLQSLGKMVELLPLGKNKTADALVDGVQWEFKLLTNYKNLFNSIKQEVKRGSKQSPNVLLHINHSYTNKEIIRGLRAAINNDKKRKIKFVALLFNDGRLYKFSRKQIESGEFVELLTK